MSCPNAAPPGFREPARVPPTGRSPRGGPGWLLAVLRSSQDAQQPVPAGWRLRMASLNRTRKDYHPPPYPRERLRSSRGSDRSALDAQSRLRRIIFQTITSGILLGALLRGERRRKCPGKSPNGFASSPGTRPLQASCFGRPSRVLPPGWWQCSQREL